MGGSKKKSSGILLRGRGPILMLRWNGGSCMGHLREKEWGNTIL